MASFFYAFKPKSGYLLAVFCFITAYSLHEFDK